MNIKNKKSDYGCVINVADFKDNLKEKEQTILVQFFPDVAKLFLDFRDNKGKMVDLLSYDMNYDYTIFGIKFIATELMKVSGMKGKRLQGNLKELDKGINNLYQTLLEGRTGESAVIFKKCYLLETNKEIADCLSARFVNICNKCGEEGKWEYHTTHIGINEEYLSLPEEKTNKKWEISWAECPKCKEKRLLAQKGGK